MSYKSYQKAPCRPFDHLYDQNYICNPSRMNKLNVFALQKSAPLHIIPCFHLMFSDGRRNFYLPQRNPLPIEPPLDGCKNKCACFFNKNLMVNPPVNFDAQNEGFKIVKELLEEKTFRSIKCQTKYRESEAQTDPYLPDAKLRDGERCVPEVAQINLSSFPNLKDIKTIERDRFRRNWENNLNGMSMEEKLRQLKIIEWENYLFREKEFNEQQNERMEHVCGVLEERMSATKLFNDEILRSTSQRNIFEVKSEKKKMRDKLNRKLRQVGKLYGKIEDDEIRVHENSNFNSSNDLDGVKISEISTEVNFKLPKSTERKWGDIFEVIQKTNAEKCQKIQLKCVDENKIDENSPDQSNFSKHDKREQNMILIQRILKGRMTQVNAIKQMNLILGDITNYRSMFQLKSLEGILPFKKYEPPLPKKEEPKIIPPQQDIKETTKIIIDNTIAQAKQIHNQKLLREAEEMRKIRRNIIEKQEKAAEIKQKRNDEIKVKLEEFYDKMTEEIIEKITPVAIELFAQQDAQNFIVEKAKAIDKMTKITSNNSKIDEEVEKIFQETLIPHVIKIISEKDEEMLALIAAHDAFEIFLNKMTEKDE